MTMPTQSERRSLPRDLIMVVAVTMAMGWLSVRFELYESLFNATRRWEALQLDELPAVLAVLALALMWFAWRRYREAVAELTQRRLAEARLAELLQENRRLGQQYVQAQEEERKRLARELHDEAGQYLNAIKTDAVGIHSRSEHGPEPVRRASAAIIEHTDRAYDAIRTLIRELRPVGLDELGLKAALEHYVEQWQRRFPEVRCLAASEGDLESLDEQTSLAIYRLTQEGLSNVARHSRATQVELRVSRAMGGTEVRFEISDNGCGAVLSEPKGGMGLIGMRERVQMLGGTVNFRSSVGAGFAVAARIPVPVAHKQRLDDDL